MKKSRRSTAFERPEGNVHEIPSPGEQVSIEAARIEAELATKFTPSSLPVGTIRHVEVVAVYEDGTRAVMAIHAVNQALGLGMSIQFGTVNFEVS